MVVTVDAAASPALRGSASGGRSGHGVAARRQSDRGDADRRFIAMNETRGAASDPVQRRAASVGA